MEAVISTAAMDHILAQAASDPGREVCGLLFGSPDAIDRAQPCANTAADPSRTFEVDPRVLLAAHRQGRAGGPRLVGCYHSHPSGNAEPSPRDAAAAAPDGWLWLIVAAGSIRAWRAVAAGQLHGRFDPVVLQVGPSCARADVPSQSRP